MKREKQNRRKLKIVIIPEFAVEKLNVDPTDLKLTLDSIELLLLLKNRMRLCLLF
jgi:hypothetical protein